MIEYIAFKIAMGFLHLSHICLRLGVLGSDLFLSLGSEIYKYYNVEEGK
jgi:hypothetical protein